MMEKILSKKKKIGELLVEANLLSSENLLEALRLQKQNGGNSNIGRELYPILQSAGFSNIFVSPRMVYVDAGKPQLVDGFIKNTFTAMIEGVRENAVNQGILDYVTFDKGIKDLYRTSEPDGVFSYTFFKGFAVKKG